MTTVKNCIMRLLPILALGCALNVAQAEESAADRAADATKRAAKNTNSWIRRAARKTDAALDRAADKVGLEDHGAEPNRSAPPGQKAGPRPGG